MTQLRLLKINVQPVFVVDDGEELSEQIGQTLAVQPSQWESFATTFIEEVGRVQREYASQNEVTKIGDDS